MSQGHKRQHTITLAQELENELRETIERYELIFRATNDILYELNLETGVVVWNDALYDGYGYSSDEDTGTLEWWTGHVHPEDALRIENEISVWFEGIEDTWQTEYRFQKADGSYVYVRDRGLVQRNADGVPIRIIGSMLDITKQKQLDRAKDEFISLVSHQLRTPLTAIRIYSEMLASGLLGPLDDRQKEHVSRIADSSVRLVHLVSGILDASKVELGSVESHPEKTDINKFIISQIKELQPASIEKGIDINFVPNSRVKEILVDRNALGVILNNLLTNATRYTLPGGTVSVSLVKSKGSYMLNVKDNGIGIPKSAQPYIFNRFYRADNTANIEEHGTGLGLYMVKQMAEKVGYKITVTSAEGKGSTFSIRIPE
jgi:two-component system, chemotaxis family, CheB/CheR fusion protein